MTGEELKKKLLSVGLQQKDVAQKLGKSQQNVSQMMTAADVRTGLIEELCKAFDLPPSLFYGDGGVTATNHSVALNGNGNDIKTTDEALVRVIERQSQQISDLIDIISKQK